MIPFMAKYEKDKEVFVRWLREDDQDDEEFPESNRHGATPQLPKKPTLEELHDYYNAGRGFDGEELPGKEEVYQELQLRDPTGTLRYELAKQRLVFFFLMASIMT